MLLYSIRSREKRWQRRHKQTRIGKQRPQEASSVSCLERMVETWASKKTNIQWANHGSNTLPTLFHSILTNKPWDNIFILLTMKLNSREIEPQIPGEKRAALNPICAAAHASPNYSVITINSSINITYRWFFPDALKIPVSLTYSSI